MPNLNIPIDDELMREIRVRAAQSNMTRRGWLIKSLTDVVGSADDLGSESTTQSEPGSPECLEAQG
jgi:hypothetical protein